jgi:nucleoside-diphosphate kinase
MIESTFTIAIIKPHLVRENKIGEVISFIEKAGFVIKEMSMEHLTVEEAETFYEVHADKPFYKDLCTIMSESPVVAMQLEKEGSNNVVQEFRNLLGATDPAKSGDGTIRKLFGKSLDYNAVHGSDSAENAESERDFFFCNNCFNDWDDEYCDEDDDCCSEPCGNGSCK